METFPPPQWDVRHLAEFEDITVPAPSGSKFHLQALLVGKPSNGKEGQFKFLVSGNDHLSFKVRLRDIIDHPLFEDMIIDCQMELGSQVKNHNRIWTPGKNLFR
jgi:hypothetical protein